MKQMTQDMAARMFGYLQNRIGSHVSCKVWRYGELHNVEGVLKNVIPFDQVVLDTEIIPFVSDHQAIEEIAVITADKTKLPLFTNPLAKGYNINGSVGVALAKQEMFDYSNDIEKLQNSTVRRRR